MSQKEIATIRATVIPRETLSQAVAEHYEQVPDAEMPGSDFRLRDPRWVFDILTGYLSARKVLSELGITGQHYIKTVNGKDYVIIKGYAGLRKHLNAPRYLASNQKMLHFGLGPIAGKQYLVKNSILSVAFVAAADVAEYFLSDEQTLSQLAGSLIVSVSVAALATFAGAVVGSALVAATGYAAVGMVAGIAVSIATSALATFVDEQVEIVDKISGLIDRVGDIAFDGGIRDGEILEPQDIGYDVTRPSNEQEFDASSDQREDSNEQYDESYQLDYDDQLQEDYYDGYEDPSYGYDDYDRGAGYDYDGGYSGYDGYDGYDGDYDVVDNDFWYSFDFDFGGKSYTITIGTPTVKLYKK